MSNKLPGQIDHIVYCDCDGSNHLVRFTFWPADKTGPACVWVHQQLNPEYSFWRRLVAGIKYILTGRDEGTCWDETQVYDEDLDKLCEFFAQVKTEMETKVE